MNHKYLLFSGSVGAPFGGIYDLKHTSDSIDDLKRHFINNAHSYQSYTGHGASLLFAQIVSIDTLKTVCVAKVNIEKNTTLSNIKWMKAFRHSK